MIGVDDNDEFAPPEKLTTLPADVADASDVSSDESFVDELPPLPAAPNAN